ncbi:MAG: hypothetical protein V8S14_00080 [Lachnospiraceae bacterium]
MISDEEAYWQYLDGIEQGADILVDRYGDALTITSMDISMIYMNQKI